MCRLGCGFCHVFVELRAMLHFSSHSYFKVPPNTCHIALNLHFCFPKVSVILVWREIWYITEYHIPKPYVHILTIHSSTSNKNMSPEHLSCHHTASYMSQNINSFFILVENMPQVYQGVPRLTSSWWWYKLSHGIFSRTLKPVFTSKDKAGHTYVKVKNV